MKKYRLLLLTCAVTFNVAAQSWQKVQLIPSPGFSIAMWDAKFYNDTCFLMSSYGYFFHTDDFFQSFTVDSTYNSKFCDALSFASHDTAYIACSHVQGGMLMSVNRGDTWNPMPFGIPHGFGIGDVFTFPNPTHGYGAFRADGTYSSTNNGGVSWISPFLPSLLGYKIFQIQFTNDSTGYLLNNDWLGSGEDGYLSIHKTIDSGNNWQLMSQPILQGRGDMLFTDDTTVIVVVDGAIVKSRDGGMSFDTVMRSNVNYDQLGRLERSISFANHDTGFVAYYRTVYKTTDAGDSWVKTDFTFDNDDLDNEIYCIRAASANKVIVGCRNSNIYKTTTGGGVWSGIKETERESKGLLYPNPATTQLSIQTNGTAIEQVNIYNTTGSLVLSALGSTILKGQLSIVHLPSGLYIADIKTKEGSARKRWVKM